MNEVDISGLRKRLQALTDKKTRMEGQRDQVRKTLKTQFKINSSKAATAAKEKLISEIVKLQEKIESSSEKINESLRRMEG